MTAKSELSISANTLSIRTMGTLRPQHGIFFPDKNSLAGPIHMLTAILRKKWTIYELRNCLEIRELAAQRCTRSIREGIGSDPSCFGREPRREGWYDKVRMLLNKNSDCQCG